MGFGRDPLQHRAFQLSLRTASDKLMAAMRAKYWTDILVRYEEHPLIMRLVQNPPPAP